MVKEGVDFVVYDAKTGEDITRSVLAQIIFEEESRAGQNLLPIQFLRQLIGFYGDQMQAFVPSYLEMSPGQLLPAAGAHAQPVGLPRACAGRGAGRRLRRSRSGRTWRCSTGR